MPITRFWRLQRLYRDVSKPIAPQTAIRWDKYLDRLYLFLTFTGLTTMLVYSYFTEPEPDYADPIDRQILQSRQFGNKEGGIAVMYKPGEGFVRREFGPFDVNTKEILEAERQEYNERVRQEPNVFKKIFGPG